MNPTPFEKANDLATNLATSLALHQALKDLERVQNEAKDSPDQTAQINIGAEILFQALITLAGDDIAEA
jgi:hypothetical protein